MSVDEKKSSFLLQERLNIIDDSKQWTSIKNKRKEFIIIILLNVKLIFLYKI